MTDDKRKDTLFSASLERIVDFRFDESVAAVFPDMINRSVPGYATLVNLISILAADCVTEGSRVYDLGCSLGAVSLAIRRRLGDRKCTIVAVDNAEAMIDRARSDAARFPECAPIEYRCRDVADVDIDGASLVVMNYTMQFIPAERRQPLINKIYQGLNPGGCFILSEKVQFGDADSRQFFERAHEQFKKANGYSELEISQKRQALENVLIPDQGSTHVARLAAAGFRAIIPWFQCLNFVSWIARR